MNKYVFVSATWIPMRSWVCGNCGRSNPDSADYCLSCGQW